MAEMGRIQRFAVILNERQEWRLANPKSGPSAFGQVATSGELIGSLTSYGRTGWEADIRRTVRSHDRCRKSGSGN